MFSALPTQIGHFDIECPEFTYHLYMPIKMGDCSSVRMPQHLACFWPLVQEVMSIDAHEGRFMYITVKHMYVQRGGSANRPGWHIDGYGSDDQNFIWSNCLPTEFVSGDFDLSEDHDHSLTQMAKQAEGRQVVTYPEGALLGLGPTSVHRVAECRADVLRTFCKVSVSRYQYNLRGNAHNRLFDYAWPMVDRQASRNHPIGSLS